MAEIDDKSIQCPICHLYIDPKDSVEIYCGICNNGCYVERALTQRDFDWDWISHGYFYSKPCEDGCKMCEHLEGKRSEAYEKVDINGMKGCKRCVIDGQLISCTVCYENNKCFGDPDEDKKSGYTNNKYCLNKTYTFVQCRRWGCYEWFCESCTNRGEYETLCEKCEREHIDADGKWKD